MQYRFQGDVLQLIRYRIGWTETNYKMGRGQGM